MTWDYFKHGRRPSADAEARAREWGSKLCHHRYDDTVQGECILCTAILFQEFDRLIAEERKRCAEIARNHRTHGHTTMDGIGHCIADQIEGANEPVF